MILGVQLLGFCFGILMLYMAFVRIKRREFTQNEGLFFTVLWLVFIALVLFPRIIEPITNTLNISRKLDLLAVAGIIFLSFATYYNYILTRSTQKKVDEIISRTAIRNAKKKK